MKVVILAGGLGTRLSEETSIKPKPMIEIGGKPILWHIMKLYSFYGIKEFVICCGFKGYVIKEYFSNYFLHMSDVTFDMKKNKLKVHQNYSEPWNVTLVDTGLDSNTGGRLKRIYDYVKKDKFFFMTYGDGLSNINIKKLASFHKSHGKLATVSAVLVPSRFGTFISKKGIVTGFKEKAVQRNSFVNGGFFVLSPKCLNLIDDDSSIWEKDPMNKLSTENELRAYEHKGFWQPMDTLRDKNLLEDLWNKNKAPWRVWD